MQQVKVSQWGHSLGFRIPRGVADSLNIQAGDILELSPAEEGVLIKKTSAGKRYCLADILDSFAAASERPEVDFGPAQGEEIW
jgi:antitoxin MazE